MGVPVTGKGVTKAVLQQRLLYAAELEAKSKAELRADANAANLKVSGTKAALRKRLLANLGAEPESSAANSDADKKDESDVATPAADAGGSDALAARRIELNKLKKDELEKECEKLGVPTSGKGVTKAVLHERLMTAAELDSKTKTELKDAAAAAKCKVSGTKADLIARIIESKIGTDDDADAQVDKLADQVAKKLTLVRFDSH